MKKIYQKISKIFESRATVFFATLALVFGTFYCLEKYEKNKYFSVNGHSSAKTKLSNKIKKSLTTEVFSVEDSSNLCSADYHIRKSWRSSTTYKTDAPWSTAFMQKPLSPVPGPGGGYFEYYYFDNKTDINGDGLPDYVKVHRDRVGSMLDCVYLSNGQGWDLAYKCYKAYSSDTYYGDCAG